MRIELVVCLGVPEKCSTADVFFVGGGGGDRGVGGGILFILNKSSSIGGGLKLSFVIKGDVL